MIMLTTFASTVMYIFNGVFNYRWIGWFLIWCGLGVFFGMIYIQGAIKKTGRVSVVVLLLAFVVALSTVLGAGGNIIDLIRSKNAGVDIWKG